MKTSDFIKKIDLRYDSYNLKNDWKKLSKIVPLDNNQICLTHTKNCVILERWTQGTGSLLWDEKNINCEIDYTEIHQDLKEFAPYMYGICLEMKDRYNIGRIRIMTMEPSYVYPIHHDYERRWHIAIKAPRDSFLYFKLNESYILHEDILQAAHGIGFHIPDDGCVYEIDAGMIHTACNGGNSQSNFKRVHLVFDECYPLKGV